MNQQPSQFRSPLTASPASPHSSPTASPASPRSSPPASPASPRSSPPASPPAPSRFVALEVAVALIGHLREPVAAIARADAALADQLRRAGSSVPLNVAEGRRRSGKDRLHHFRIAAGSADEVLTALRVAQGWGHVDGAAVAAAVACCDRLLGLLWGLTH